MKSTDERVIQLPKLMLSIPLLEDTLWRISFRLQAISGTKMMPASAESAPCAGSRRFDALRSLHLAL
jgi:hypothetical protein